LLVINLKTIIAAIASSKNSLFHYLSQFSSGEDSRETRDDGDVDSAIADRGESPFLLASTPSSSDRWGVVLQKRIKNETQILSFEISFKLRLTN